MTYNRIYTKEKWQKVNEYNKSILNDYIMECKAQKKPKFNKFLAVVSNLLILEELIPFS